MKSRHVVLSVTVERLPGVYLQYMFSSRMTAVRVVVPLMVAVATLLMLGSGWSARMDLPIRDVILALGSEHGAVSTAVVAIDETSLERAGPWPWKRSELGRLIEIIATADPEVIVLDILLTEPSEEDAALEQALQRTDTILAATLNDDRTWILPQPRLAELTEVGHASLDVDHDGVMRRLTSTRQSAGISLPALSVMAAAVYDTDRSIPVARRITPDFSTRPGSIPTISAGDVLDGTGELSRLDGRIVFLGITALGLGDRVMTPVSHNSPVPGVLVHASITESLIQNRLLHPLPPWVAALAAAGLAWIAMRLTGLGGWSRVLAAVSAMSIPLVAGFLLLEIGGIEIPIATLTFFPVIGVLGVEIHAAFFTNVKAAQTEALLNGSADRNPSTTSPEKRMAHLLELAEQIGKERTEESDSRRALAHELKTPLTSVRGLAQLLSGFELSEDERKRVASMMVQETTRLHSLIEQLLDIERIQLTNFEETATATDVSALATSRLEILHRTGRHPILGSIDPGVEVLGRADLLALVLDNLLANASRYSPDGSTIQVRLSRGTARRVVLEVEDAGPGIPVSERQTIFNRFVRGSTSAGTQGLGLGLALVREIVSWHRGTIEVLPAPFGGSIFRIELEASERSQKEIAS